MSAHRAPAGLTARGRAVRDLAAGAAILGAALAGEPLLVGYFTAVQWLGRVLGTA